MYDALTGNIDFGEGLKCLRRGQCIARRGWPGTAYLYSSGSMIYFHPGSSNGWSLPYRPADDDLMATDWFELV